MGHRESISLLERRRDLIPTNILSAVVAVAFIATITINQPVVAQTDTYVVSSGSMEPILEVNDVIVIDRNYPFEDIQIGDIILFMRPDGADRTIVSRVITINPDSTGDRIITTKGDANPSPIPGTDFPITRDVYFGKVVNVIPDVGIITKIISPPVNYIIMAGLWDGIIIIYAIYRRSKKKKPVSSNMDAAMQPLDVYNTVQKIIGASRLAIKNALPDQTIVAEGGRDFS